MSSYNSQKNLLTKIDLFVEMVIQWQKMCLGNAMFNFGLVFTGNMYFGLKMAHNGRNDGHVEGFLNAVIKGIAYSHPGFWPYAIFRHMNRKSLAEQDGHPGIYTHSIWAHFVPSTTSLLLQGRKSSYEEKMLVKLGMVEPEALSRNK